MNQGLEQSDTDSFQDSSLKLNVRSGQSRSSSLLSESSSQPEIHPFFKDSYGKFIVLYSYHGQDENDLSVERGQLVTVLNKVTKLQMSLLALLFSLMNVSAGWQSQSQWPPAIEKLLLCFFFISPPGRS